MKQAALAGKALSLLEILGEEQVCSIPALADAAGLPVSTVHRIIRTLLDLDYVTCLGRGRYVLGPAMLRLGAAVSETRLLANIGRPLMEELAQKARFHVYLGVLEGDMVTYLVTCIGGSQPYASTEGAQLEAYCSGIGKALLAYLPERQRQAYLRQDLFVALTPNTITSDAGLHKELEAVRARGWACDNEEMALGLKCAAVPVFDARGRVCAAISASGAAERMTPATVASLVASLGDISAQISHRIFPR